MNIGFYTSVYGLGLSPKDVTINSIYVDPFQNEFGPLPNSLDVFWRSAENFITNGDTLWSAS